MSGPLLARTQAATKRAELLDVLLQAVVVLEDVRATDDAVFDAAEVLENIAERFRLQRTLNPQETFAVRQQRRRTQANPTESETQNTTRHHE